MANERVMAMLQALGPSPYRALGMPEPVSDVTSGASTRQNLPPAWLSPIQAGLALQTPQKYQQDVEQYGYPAATAIDLYNTLGQAPKTIGAEGVMGAGQLLQALGPIGGMIAGRVGQQALEGAGGSLYDYGRAQGVVPGAQSFADVAAGSSTAPTAPAQPDQAGLQAAAEQALAGRAKAHAAARAAAPALAAPKAGPTQPAAGGLYDLEPTQQALLDKFAAIGKPSGHQAPEPGERMANVLGGLAAGAAGYIPGSRGGGLARALAGAGAGAQQAESQWRTEQEQNRLADEAAVRQYQMQQVQLESHMRENAAKMHLLGEQVQARHTANQIRMMGIFAAQSRFERGVKTAVNTPSGVQLIGNTGANMGLIPPVMNTQFFISHGKDLAAIGGVPAANQWIADNVAKISSDAPDLAAPRTLALQMVTHGWFPDVLAAVQKKIMEENPAVADAFFTDPQKGQNVLDDAMVNELSWMIFQNPDLANTVLDRVGDVSVPTVTTPFQRGFGQAAAIERGLRGGSGD